MTRGYGVWLILLFLNGVFGFANTQPAHVEVSTTARLLFEQVGRDPRTASLIVGLCHARLPVHRDISLLAHKWEFLFLFGSNPATDY